MPTIKISNRQGSIAEPTPEALTALFRAQGFDDIARAFLDGFDYFVFKMKDGGDPGNEATISPDDVEDMGILAHNGYFDDEDFEAVKSKS